VPNGLIITGQSANTLQVWLRGNELLLDTVDPASVAARCDLGSAHVGLNPVSLDAAVVDIPFGIQVEAVAPRQLQVRLASATQVRSGP